MKKSILITVHLMLFSATAFAVNDCRNLKSAERSDLKQSSCEAIAKLQKGHQLVDVNECIKKAKFNLCENMDFGFGSNIEVSGLYNNFGIEYVCTIDIRKSGELLNVDCNGNY